MAAPVRSRSRASALALALTAGVVVVACTSTADDVPVRPAPPSSATTRALVDSLSDDARSFAFAAGDWEEDQGDAPFFGLAWLSHRAAAHELDADGLARRDAAVARAVAFLGGDLGAAVAAATPSAPVSPSPPAVRLAGGDGALEDKLMAALGLIEHVGASGDRSLVPALDDFLDRLDARTRSLGEYFGAGVDGSLSLRTYGPTAVTALVAFADAEYALFVGGPRADERTARAIVLDEELHGRAFTDLVDATNGASARGFAFAPGQPLLVDLPNVIMLLLETRLFRLTKTEDYRLEARALFAALQPLKLADAPARYSSSYAQALLGVDTRDLSTLAGQSYVAWALLLLFEITGDQRFVDEADRIIDAIATMRGPWCASQVHDGSTCAPACGVGQACTASACAGDRCATGLLHHVIDGRLARPDDGIVFCSGCNFEALYVLGYRRQLAGEPY